MIYGRIYHGDLLDYSGAIAIMMPRKNTYLRRYTDAGNSILDYRYSEKCFYRGRTNGLCRARL